MGDHSSKGWLVDNPNEAYDRDPATVHFDYADAPLDVSVGFRGCGCGSDALAAVEKPDPLRVGICLSGTGKFACADDLTLRTKEGLP
jgi:hypothetical protein